jgi:hypothetical protein
MADDESIRRWAHYPTDALERLLAQVEAENGRTLAELLAEIRAEIARRRALEASG